MKIKRFILGLALATSLLVQPIMAETVKAEQLTPATSTVEVTQEVVEMKELTPATPIAKPEVKPVAKKPVKTFKVKPVVVNGVSYISVKDLEKHLGVKWTAIPQYNGVELLGPNALIWFRDLPNDPQINRAHVPCSSKVKKFNGVIHVPAKYVLDAFNCKVAYDKKSNTLTVDFYGKKDAPKMVDTQMNVIKGRVLDKNGNPVKGAKVNFTTANNSGNLISTTHQERPNFPVGVVTDENGYYEFAPLDTVAHPNLQVSVEHSVNGKLYEGYTPGTFDYDTKKLQPGFLRISSKTETMPTIYIYENIWD